MNLKLAFTIKMHSPKPKLKRFNFTWLCSVKPHLRTQIITDSMPQMAKKNFKKEGITWRHQPSQKDGKTTLLKTIMKSKGAVSLLSGYFCPSTQMVREANFEGHCDPEGVTRLCYLGYQES